MDEIHRPGRSDDASMNDDQRPSASTAAQLARLGERVHAMANRMQETTGQMREMSVSIRDVAKEFNVALREQSERFLGALKEQGDRHEREMDTLNSRFENLATVYVKKGEISQQWQVFNAVAKIVSWAAFIGVPVVAFALYRAGVLRP